jgi:hypothetical protein
MPIDPEIDMPPLRNPDLDAERPAVAVDEQAIDAKLSDEVQVLIDPLRDIVTTTRTSLNRTAELAKELGTTESALREALQSLVERGDLAQNKATGAFMRKSTPPITTANTKRPRTLIEWIAEQGGANDFGGELRALGLRPNDKRFGKKVIRAIERAETQGGPSGAGDSGLDSLFRDAREAGFFPEFEGRAEGSYDDLLDGAAMLLEAIDAELSGMPRFRMDDWDRLAEYKLTGSTEGIYGGRIGQNEMDDLPVFDDLTGQFRDEWAAAGNDLADLDDEFLYRAAELYYKGDAFLPEHALAMAAAEDYERALAGAIHDGLAKEYQNYDPWNPEWDAEFERRFEAARARDRADGNALAGSERLTFDEAFGPEGSAPAASRGPDDGTPQSLNPREQDELAAARPRADHSDLPPDTDPRFDEPAGEGIKATADSVWHDIDANPATDPNIAARQRTEAQLRAEAPMRANTEQDGTMGSPLFDAADQPLFDLGDGRGERSLAQIRDEITADKSAIEEIRKCL